MSSRPAMLRGAGIKPPACLPLFAASTHGSTPLPRGTDALPAAADDRWLQTLPVNMAVRLKPWRARTGARGNSRRVRVFAIPGLWGTCMRTGLGKAGVDLVAMQAWGGNQKRKHDRARGAQSGMKGNSNENDWQAWVQGLKKTEQA